MKVFPNGKRFPAAIGAALFLAVAAAGGFARFVAVAPGSGEKVQFFDVGQGATLKRIAGDLEKARLVSSARLFMLYARLKGADSKAKAGTYQLNDGMSPGEILRRMIAGEVFVRRFSVPEGYSVYQVAELLESRDIFSREAFLKECSNQQLLKELGIAGKSVEGYLYPSTYDIPLKMDAAGFIRIGVEQFNRIYGQRFASLANGSGMGKAEIVTLASMVEKEAVQSSERPLIASVFLNRLRKGMPLQSDPTAVYGIRAFAGKVSKQDIMRPSPYNTYLVKGLPPGPIGSPGGGTIEAVLNPARTEFLYFVAKKDGSHYFSTNLAEHNRAVRKYLKRAMATGAEPAKGYRNDYPSLTGGR